MPANQPTNRQHIHLLQLIEEGRITVENLQGFLEKPDQFIRPKYPVTVNYDLTLAEMIKECGKYFCDPGSTDIIVKNITLEGKGKVSTDLTLVHCDEDIFTEEVERKIFDQGLQFAKIEHLLAFGAKFPGLQMKFPIVALGNRCVVSGGFWVPVLGKDGTRRILRLDSFSHEWRGNYRFLALSK